MDNVHARAKKGIKILMGRQALLQIFTFAGSIVLARVLDPAQFGLYAIAAFVVQTMALLGDFGLAPSFIQRKNDLQDRELQVGFTLQQIITTTIVIILFVTAPWLARLYPHAPPETVWLVRILAFDLYLTSWRSMSTLQLERKLRYDRLAIVEVVETVSFQALAVGLALAHFGVWSFVWAALARGLLGSALVYWAAPWRIRFAFDATIAKEILRFGIPFQISRIISSASGWVTPTLVGALVGPQAVGYLTWASSNAKKPLMLVDNIMRVAFPHFARIQDDPDEVERLMGRYLNMLLLPAGLWFAAILVAGPATITLIFSEKWRPAVPALTFFAAAVSLDVIVWVVGVTMNALGMAYLAANRALARPVTHILLSLPFVYLWGYTGVASAYLVALIVTLPFTFNGMQAGAMRRVLAPVAWVLWPILGSCALGAAVMHFPGPMALRAVLGVASVTAAYAGITLLAGPAWLREKVQAALASRFGTRVSVIQPEA